MHGYTVDRMLYFFFVFYFIFYFILFILSIDVISIPILEQVVTSSGRRTKPQRGI